MRSGNLNQHISAHHIETHTMPFFNFRRSTANASQQQANAQPESMEVIRKRARHRLIGAAVLVLAAVVGFPLLFDSQPRPIAVDIPIEIPGKNTVKPLSLPGKAEVAVSAPSRTATVAAASSLNPKEEIMGEKASVSKPVLPTIPAAAQVNSAQTAPKKEANTEPKVVAKSESKPEPKPVAKAEDGARAKALLEGLAPVASDADVRLIVQVGAFADNDKAREVRQKLEKAGFKTYTQVAETKDGKRIRVRVGPFATKAQADKAASKIKALDLPASILTL